MNMVSILLACLGVFFQSLVLHRAIKMTHAYGEREFVSAMAWCVVLLVANALSCVARGLGLLVDDVFSTIALALAFAAATAAISHSKTICARTCKRIRHPYLRALGVCLLASVFAMLALELPSNHDLWNMHPGPALLELALIFGLLALLFFATRRHAQAPSIGIVALTGVGIAEYFVISFKSMPIQPGDLFALSTAATVAGSYHYVLSAYCVYGIAFAVLAITTLVLAPALGAGNAENADAKPRTNTHTAAKTSTPTAAPSETAVNASRKTARINTDGAGNGKERGIKLPLSIDRRTAVISALALAGQATISYYDVFGIQLHTWKPLTSYYSQGFLPTFISSAQKMVPPKPKRYSGTETAQLIKHLAHSWKSGKQGEESAARAAAVEQFNQIKPSVICIMNESFADLSIFDGLGCGYQGPTRFKSIDDALLQGVSYMSAFGAGTCNSEFEFLTGHSMAYLGSGVYPFMTYNLAPTENLARQFKKLGYHAVAMHPNHATNWNRENVFADMGFDEFLSIKDFANAQELCGKVTDAATYNKCLEVLRANDGPVFIHDVTMQNHSGYATGLVPADKQLYLPTSGVTPEVQTWTNEYCSLMEQSDIAFDKFLSELRELDRPVVVVMYGDHQPFFTDRYNDLLFDGEDDVMHAERLWQTRYVVWANYDVAGNDQKSKELDTSINNVGALMVNAIGAPLTAYQRARLTNRKNLPTINVVGLQDAQNSWYTLESNDLPQKTATAADRLQRMQYRTLFDHAGSVFATKKQTTANETDANIAPGEGA